MFNRCSEPKHIWNATDELHLFKRKKKKKKEVVNDAGRENSLWAHTGFCHCFFSNVAQSYF